MYGLVTVLKTATPPSGLTESIRLTTRAVCLGAVPDLLIGQSKVVESTLLNYETRTKLTLLQKFRSNTSGIFSVFRLVSDNSPPSPIEVPHQLSLHMEAAGAPIVGRRRHMAFVKSADTATLACLEKVEFVPAGKKERVTISHDLPPRFYRMVELEERFYVEKRAAEAALYGVRNDGEQTDAPIEYVVGEAIFYNRRYVLWFLSQLPLHFPFFSYPV